MPSRKKGDLRVVTLNIDWDKNLKTVLPFLSELHADVSCLQEVREEDLPAIAAAAGEHYHYVSMCGGSIHGASSTVGVAIFSRTPISRPREGYYVGSPDNIVELDESSLESRRATTYRAIVSGEVNKDCVPFRIVTTHFTWTPDGKPDEFQRRDLEKMLDMVKREGGCVFCGDFNAPRGGEIFTTLSRRFRDNVPARYISSLDPKIHRLKHFRVMVDGVFTTPRYSVSGMRMVSGVSDHRALTFTVSRR